MKRSFCTCAVSLLLLTAGCERGDTPRSAAASAPSIAAAEFADVFALRDSVVLEQPDSALIVRVSGLDVDGAGRIVVGDASEGNVKLYSREGRLLRVIGRKGRGPGEFLAPRYPRWGPDGLIHVADAQAIRIQAFDTTGALRRVTQLRDVSMLDGFRPLAGGRYLVAVPRAASGHALVEVDTAGRETRRFVSVAPDLRPTGQGEYPMWRNIRSFSLAVHGDTAFLSNTLSDTLWTVDLRSGAESRTFLRFPGYVPPTLPATVPAGIPELFRWSHSFHLSSSLSAGSGALYLPFVQGVLNNGDAMILVMRTPRGEWQALANGPPIIGAHADQAVGLLSPGSEQVRLGFFSRRAAP